MTLYKPCLYKPCIRASGPNPAKIIFVGEAPGAREEEEGIPFVGNAGHLFNEMLGHAEINRAECYLTNVLFTRPPNNKLEAFLVPRTDPGALAHLPALFKGGYLKSDFRPELERLDRELRSVRSNLIVALGNTASWAILKQTAISKIRGTVVPSPWGKVLPTFHPSGIFQVWSNYPILVADLIKAKRESEFPELRRPQREIIIDPTLADIEEFYWLCVGIQALSIDIETQLGQITSIGFARSPQSALVIPIVDHRKPDKCFWSTHYAERIAWGYIQKFLELPCVKIFQNGLYDLQYLRKMKLHVVNATEDTMLLHHSMHPELLKGLGFMGSIYTSEPAWKLMRRRGDEQFKRDDE